MAADRLPEHRGTRGRGAGRDDGAARLRARQLRPGSVLVAGGLEIREFGPEDAARVAALVAAGDLTAFPPGFPGDVAEVEAWLAEGVHERRRTGEGVHLVLVAGGEIVGSAGLRETDWDAGCTEIGYGVRADRRGRGFATVAARAVARWALTDGGLRQVRLHARLDNGASVRVAEKAGFRREGTEGDLAAFVMEATDS